MQPPSYLLPRPPFDLAPEKQAAFEDLYRSFRKGAEIFYTLPHPKWQFLFCLCDMKELVLHGSQMPDIIVVEPHQAFRRSPHPVVLAPLPGGHGIPFIT